MRKDDPLSADSDIFSTTLSVKREVLMDWSRFSPCVRTTPPVPPPAQSSTHV